MIPISWVVQKVLTSELSKNKTSYKKSDFFRTVDALTILHLAVAIQGNDHIECHCEILSISGIYKYIEIEEKKIYRSRTKVTFKRNSKRNRGIFRAERLIQPFSESFHPKYKKKTTAGTDRRAQAFATAVGVAIIVPCELFCKFKVCLGPMFLRRTSGRRGFGVEFEHWNLAKDRQCSNRSVFGLFLEYFFYFGFVLIPSWNSVPIYAHTLVAYLLLIRRSNCYVLKELCKELKVTPMRFPTTDCCVSIGHGLRAGLSMNA